MRRLLLTLSLLLPTTNAAAQDLTIAGPDGRDVKVPRAEIQALPHQLVRTTDPHSKAPVEYGGVALAEIDPEMTESTVLIADELNGAPLPKELAPYRLVVPGEKKAARWVRQVTRIAVVQASAAR